MEREFTYTKERLLFILEQLLEQDIQRNPIFQAPERVEEGFEKRAAIDFLLWFLNEAFPEGFSFCCCFDELEREYGEELARRIAEGAGWSARHVRIQGGDDKVIHVDFSH